MGIVLESGTTGMMHIIHLRGVLGPLLISTLRHSGSGGARDPLQMSRTHILIWSCVFALVQSDFGQRLRTFRCRAKTVRSLAAPLGIHTNEDRMRKRRPKTRSDAFTLLAPVRALLETLAISVVS